jgi:FkbM family methyltransferase
MAKVFVFIPAFGRQITTTTFETSHELMSALAAKGISASIGSFSWPDIEEVRNVVLSWWYESTDFTHLLFVDADMGFPAQMVLDMLTFGEPMVGAIYRKKCDEVEWVASGGLKAPDFRKGFIEVEGLGMGCFLIRRDAIPPLIDKFPDKIYPYIAIADFRWQGPNRTLAFFDCMRTPEGKVSEDISFCRRYREAGGKVWATTAYQTLHEGPKIFAGCFGKSRELDLQQEALARRAAELMVRDAALLAKPSFPRPESPYIAVETKHGVFLCNPNDTFIGRSLIEYGEWCEFEIDLLEKFVDLGDTVIDVGANIGTHAIAFAEMVGPQGRVHAFEPQPRLAGILTQNVNGNDWQNVVLVNNCAVGSTNGIMPMAKLPPDDTEFNFGALPLLPGLSSGGSTVVMTIDSLKLRPKLIKIDVEGMEADVIWGARQTIEVCSPVLYLECNGDDTTAIADTLEKIGYCAYWSIGPYFNPHNFNASKRNIWPNVMPSVNLLAIPASLPCPVKLPAFQRGDNWKAIVYPQAAE